MADHLEVTPSGAGGSRRDFLKLSSVVLGALALAACDDDLVAAPPVTREPGIPVVPTDDMHPETELPGPLAVTAGGEWLSYVGPESIYFWPAGGGARRGPRFIMTASRIGLSGGYGLQLDRPYGDETPLEVIYSVDGVRAWETGLDLGEDASGQGRGPDFVLAYDNADPPGDRFRMAPGGYTLHSPLAGSPYTSRRFNIVGGNAEIDQASVVLYLQSGSAGNPGVADWLIRGQGRHPDTGEWGREIFGVRVDGGIVGKAISLAVEGERDLVTLSKSSPYDGAWIRFADGRDEWRVGTVADPDGLVVTHGEEARLAVGADGALYADRGLFAFSPLPPHPRERMTARAWCDWVTEEATRADRGRGGIPTRRDPDVLMRAEAEGRDPAEVAAEERTAHGRDISRLALGAGNWIVQVQEALERSADFDEFRARIAGRQIA